MKTRLAATTLALMGLMCLPAPARAETPVVKFDQGVDASAVLRQARAQAARDSGVLLASARLGGYIPDCHSFVFGPNDGLRSKPQSLSSREEPTCHPDPMRGGQYCTPGGFPYSKTVSVSLRGRGPLLPWESESIEVCLTGPWLSVRAEEAAYEYKRVDARGDEDVVLEAVRKIAMKPDPKGIAVDSLSDKLVFTLKDKWAAHYAGGKTFLKLIVKREIIGRSDPVLATLELKLDPSETYRVNLLDFLLTEKPVAGQRYFVDAFYRRLGSVSKDDEVDLKSEKTRVEYRP